MANTTFSANKVCYTVVEFLKAAGFNAFNHFGRKIEDENIAKLFAQTGAIYVFYDGCDYEREANHYIRGQIRIAFLLVDVTIGTAANKDPYTIDNLRQYLVAGSQAWQYFGLPAVYPDLNIEPFVLERETIWRFDNGFSWSVFAGHIRYHQQDLT